MAFSCGLTPPVGPGRVLKSIKHGVIIIDARIVLREGSASRVLEIYTFSYHTRGKPDEYTFTSIDNADKVGVQNLHSLGTTQHMS